MPRGAGISSIVSGWFTHAFDVLGASWLDHDGRYRRSTEFIKLLEGVWIEEVRGLESGTARRAPVPA
ncbi:LLM class flavin-dependent oxidoreductase [Ancylobacter lacus]|nr:LLM class flavin-dependent oxidoreductase [Ancylobacter lacus]